ncbi:Na/Pi cotransporter family protein [Anaerocolumna aminovalerica]|jgi:phosphate:Na+ symporter|uniref:Phosphate:Na+ symporter n=1 Tax=Anaerocolumna aminovalerica TaxID=1527 RepID=A0A1I5DAA5_9FIRM|nr:Na/Pi cotransporter family protein [Anaerocolumna aminovalerica]MBU5333817.1 Na/Pi cotransporter family protein [Anaerocolumna aminovalerica]MDU6263110.1 Na/Pi cotransporter family protein [Anaerocolumna aminovalerica]SFN96057.1 phosphate:Na+ symporter [Anaerocolumna aminovalerica]
MDIFGVLTLIGGLALFLYGMNAMGEGLEKLSGGKLEAILEKLTSNKIKAVLLGAAVTGIIQSSSATTVMVVGFVNSGIMKLSQAIGVIMGANIGTTVTSWILSLAGIESNNFFVSFLKPSSFTPVLAAIGIAFLMFSKKEKKKHIGTILIGFAILIFGMETMSDAVEPLAEVPAFINVLTAFSNPVLGMIAGAVFTAIIQSSSASVGILQALCLTGAVKYSTALPIIMGQNIGTCITAILSSIGANKNAKRAAAVHLYFNLIGTTIFMIVFYGLNTFMHFSVLGEAAGPTGIAVIHSTFNIAATIVLLPFSNLLEKLAIKTIKDGKEEKEENEFQTLDVRFLETPSYGLKLCKDMTDKMAEISKEALLSSIGLLVKYDDEAERKIIASENRVDKYEDAIGSYLVKLSSKQLSNEDSKTLSLLLHCIGDFERISDHALNIMQTAKEMKEKKVSFSKEAEHELKVFIKAVTDIMDKAVTVFINRDIEGAKSIEPLEEVIDYLHNEIKKRHINRLMEGKCTIELGFILSDITTNLERVSDHCSNIAVDVIQLNMDEFDIHEYLDVLKHEDNKGFKDDYYSVKKLYQLP